MRFKLGDRVIPSVSNKVQSETHEKVFGRFYGKPATVIAIMGTTNYLVEFDENTGGHAGGTGRCIITNKFAVGKDGHCWYMKDENLEPHHQNKEELLALYINKKINKETYEKNK